ncbi:MAG: 3-oxoacyl-[acyl-carrier-protein] reductase [Thermoplasmata archaeon]
MDDFQEDMKDLGGSLELLEGCRALITGGSQGIGRRIALEMALEGADVAINDLSSQKEKANRVAQYIESRFGRDTWIAEADVSDIDDVMRMRDQVEEHFGKIDILVNNAGINVDTFFSKMEPEQWEKVLSVNLDGVFNCTQVFIGHIKESRRGRVISISSIVGETGNLGQVNYASSKAGVIGFTKALAREMVRHHVTVNAVAPGFINTDMVKGMPDKVKKKITSQIPMGRFGEPKEVAQVITYLASEEASYITGEVVRVNGGYYL